MIDSLNPEQAQAVTTTDGPILVLSGPGSGKTRVITHRIAYLIKERGIAPDQILALTFTNKAANEMKERLKNLIGSSIPWAGTFHSICSRILRADGKYLGISPSFVIYDDQDSQELVRDILKDLNLSSKNFSPNSILNSISSAKTELVLSDDYQKYVQGYFQEVVAKVYVLYEQTLKKNQALDFDDLILQTIKLFEANPEILKKYQEKFQYILIDEYQDTNRSQYLFAKMISALGQNICVVGDASQSIYAWRGADYRNLLNFEKDFPKAKIFNLEQNYRSTKKILSVAKEVITKNKTHPILNIWTSNPEGTTPVVYQARNEVEESDFILRMINKMKDKNYSDFAVLYRTNAQSRVLEEAFLREGVPYILVGGTRFYERKEVKDMLAYLRLISNPEDNLSFKRIVNVPPRGIGPAALAQKDNPKVLEFNQTMTTLRGQAEMLETKDIIDLILASNKYEEYLNDGTPEGLARMENVKELRSVAIEFPKLGDFLENVSLIEHEYLPKDRPSSQETRNAVTLMTMHAAKGLEFSIVFMVGMEEGLFPHSRALMDLGELEEERRLCYVGITRAKEQLYFTYTQERLYFGARTMGILSRFIQDLPEELIIAIG